MNTLAAYFKLRDGVDLTGAGYNMVIYSTW